MEHPTVKLLVILVGAFRGGFEPQRRGVVDGLGLLGALAVLLGLFVLFLTLRLEINLDGHEGAIFLENGL
jgi:hypothetical protein